MTLLDLRGKNYAGLQMAIIHTELGVSASLDVLARSGRMQCEHQQCVDRGCPFRPGNTSYSLALPSFVVHYEARIQNERENVSGDASH